MPRSIPWLLMLAAAVLASSGCGSNDTTVLPTTPAPASVVETFTGTLTLNGAFTYPFLVTGIGSVTALMNTLTPDTTRPVGMALGTWNGSLCQIVLSNDAAVQGSSVPGAASSTGTFCVRIYDATGTVTSPESYVVQVEHP